MDLKELLKSESGKELKDFLLAEYNKLKNIENVKDYGSASAQALELKSQKKAVQKLRDILERIMSISETEEFDKSKDEYHIL